MAGSPALKVYRADGEYVAACRYPEDAAAIVAMHGEGSTIRLGHTKRQTVWTEGKEAQPAGESYDFVSEVVLGRIKAIRNLRPGYRATPGEG